MATQGEKYRAKLPEGWQKAMLDLYDMGASDAEIMREFGITPKAWKAMLLDLTNTEFNDVIEFGHMLAQAWWEAQSRASLNKRGFNTRLYDIVMQNRFDWSSKETTVTESAEGAANESDLDARINELKKKLSS
jgi:hypothetical protein